MNGRSDLVPGALVEQTLDLACRIQAIPAPTFNEAKRADFFLEQFQSIGLSDVHRDSVGNVLARLPGSLDGQSANGRPLVVSAHMDTVHPYDTPLDVRRLSDRIIGPGIGDNALALAALLTLGEYMKSSEIPLPGDVWLAANVGEEGLGDLRGIQAIVNHFNGDPLAYLVVEGMGLGTILHRGLGVERYKITVQTPGGHSWVDYGKPSAIHELCRIVTRLASLHLPASPNTTLNVGVIHGGTSINTIAAHAWLELDLRSEDGDSLHDLVRSVERVTRLAESGRVRVQLDRIGRRQAGMIPEDHPLVRLCQNILTELEVTPRLEVASTDANLPLSHGYPAVCVGITNGNHAHTREEFILTAPVAQGLTQLHRLMTRIWQI